MRFSQNTINQVAGYDQPILAEELVWRTDDYWDVTFTNSSTDQTAVDLTGWSFSLRLIRRLVDEIVDVRNKGIELVNLRAASGATEIVLDSNIKLVDPANGRIRMLINDDMFDEMKPAIDSVSPPVYTGYIGATMPASGTVGSEDYIPEQTKKILLLFIVSSDGISAQTT
jgi:hypothetical protein